MTHGCWEIQTYMDLQLLRVYPEHTFCVCVCGGGGLGVGVKHGVGGLGVNIGHARQQRWKLQHDEGEYTARDSVAVVSSEPCREGASRCTTLLRTARVISVGLEQE